MINLIRNENMKIYMRLRTWIMIGLLISIVVLVSLVMHNSQSRWMAADWRADYEQRIANYEQILASAPPQERQHYGYMEEELVKYRYALEHNIPPVQGTMWGAVMELTPLILLITIFTVIIAADTVAGEFSGGTIKLLLIRPPSRSRILLSKYASAFLFALLLLIVLCASGIIVNAILYGLEGFAAAQLQVNSAGEVMERSILLQILQTYALACISLIMIVTMAFMISTVFRSSALSIGISIFLMLIGQQVTMILLSFDYEWAKFILFANMDLNPYLNGGAPAEGMTMSFSILVLLGYFIVFNALSWLLFNKRDVAA